MLQVQVSDLSPGTGNAIVLTLLVAVTVVDERVEAAVTGRSSDCDVLRAGS